MNKFFVIGNLTADVEAFENENGTFARFGLAERASKERTNFFNFKAYGKPADVLFENTVKGDTVGITAHARVENWEDKDGNKRSATVFVVDDVQLLGRRAKGGETPAEIFDQQPAAATKKTKDTAAAKTATPKKKQKPALSAYDDDEETPF